MGPRTVTAATLALFVCASVALAQDAPKTLQEKVRLSDAVMRGMPHLRHR